MVGGAENKLEFGIVLAAKAGEVFVGIGVHAAHGLEDAYRRSEIAVRSRRIRCLTEVAAGAIDGQKIEDERNGSRKKDNVV